MADLLKEINPANSSAFFGRSAGAYTVGTTITSSVTGTIQFIRARVGRTSASTPGGVYINCYKNIANFYTQPTAGAFVSVTNTVSSAQCTGGFNSYTSVDFTLTTPMDIDINGIYGFHIQTTAGPQASFWYNMYQWQGVSGNPGTFCTSWSERMGGWTNVSDQPNYMWHSLQLWGTIGRASGNFFLLF